MSKPKRHHYVPSGYLKAFCCSGDSVLYFNKQKPRKGIQSRNRRKILKMPNLYSHVDALGSFSPENEVWFGSLIDNEIPPFVSQVTRIIEEDKLQFEGESLRQFSELLLINFFYRSPYTRLNAMKKKRAAISRFLLALSFLLENFRYPSDSEKLVLEQNLIQDIIAGGKKNSKNLLRSLQLYFVYPCSGEHFITGSNPVVVQFPKLKNFIFGDRIQRFYFLPLSPNSGIMFSDQVVESALVRLSEGSAQALNSIIAQQSTRVISHSREVLDKCISLNL